MACGIVAPWLWEERGLMKFLSSALVVGVVVSSALAGGPKIPPPDQLLVPSANVTGQFGQSTDASDLYLIVGIDDLLIVIGAFGPC